MRVLQVYDRQDYTEDMPVFEKYSMRGIIQKNGKIAVQKGARGDCKILGGGMDEGETFGQALMREVREEAGLLVIPDSIREIGEVIEKRRDIFCEDKIYVCHSCYFFCDVEEHMTEPEMTPSEIEKGYHLEWLTPQEMIRQNEPFLDEAWIRRDTEFIRQLPEWKENHGE